MKSLASRNISSAWSECIEQSARRVGVIVRRSSAERVMKIVSFLAPLLFLVLVTGAQEVRAQIAVDSVSGVTGPTSDQISRTWSHTVGSGSNRILIVGVSIKDGAANVNSVTYGGTALVSIGSRTDGGLNTKIAIWKLVAPASGLANIVVTLSAAKRIVAGSVSFTGVDQTTPNGAFASNVGTNGTPTVNVSSASGELVIDTFAVQGDASPATVGGGQTQRWNRNTGALDNNEVLGGGSTEPGASTVTMSWGLGQAQPWSIGAVSLKPAIQDLTIAKSHSGNFTQGQTGATYSITVTNSGSANTSGTVTVTDTLPAGLTATAIAGTGWTCVLGTLTCTRGDALAGGASYPVITLTVNVANNAPASVTNSVSVSGGGQTNTANDTANDPTTINQFADLTITKSHSGNFSQGQVGATYSIIATNSGAAATSGTVTVSDTLPAGLTATAISGTGWACVLGTLTCSRSDVLAAGSSYPVITLTVNVANNAAASVTNTANVSGGGQIITTNDSANDPTTINQLPDLTITKSHTGNFTQGQVGATYLITATNSGSAATSGTVTVTDTLPAGLTATAISGTGWTCVLGTLTCTRNDALAAGASYPAITLTVDVSLTAPGSVTNSATVSGGGETNVSNNTANDPTTIDTAAPPSISLVKSVSPGGEQAPGTDLLYTIVYTNTGGQPANNFIIIDPNMANVVPAERVFLNVDFKVGSLTSSPGTTGLVATYEYSNDGGTTWTYTPVSGADGAPAGYDRLVTNVRWTFTGNLSQSPPNNAGSVGFTVRIR